MSLLKTARSMPRRWPISLLRDANVERKETFFLFPKLTGSLPLRSTQGLGPILQRNALPSSERDQLERFETRFAALQKANFAACLCFAWFSEVEETLRSHRSPRGIS